LGSQAGDHIRIPRFDPGDRGHQRLADLSARAHDAARRDDASTLKRIEAQTHRQAARLWGLTDQELAEIQRGLQELTAKEPSAEAEEEVADAVKGP
jgi:hypothetical protein